MNARSHHAARRAQQRCIPPLISQWLDAYGEEAYDGRGGVVRFFSRRSVREMERSFGRAPVARLSEYLDCYKVESSRDGTTITVGHRTKRIHRR
jgi:hypothetical protein